MLQVAIALIGITLVLVIPALFSQKKPIEETDLLEEDHDCEYWDKIKLVPRDTETYPKEYDYIY